MACRQGTDNTGEPESYILTPCFEAMINELLKATDRLFVVDCKIFNAISYVIVVN